MSPEQQLSQLTAGTAKVLSEKELLEKLKLGRPLRIKLGVDPTAPDIHFGHTVALEKLRQFQLLGHQAVLLIGDFTATIGDPSGRSATRPPLTRDEVLENAATYTEQAFKILDREKTEVVYNGDWFRKMSYEEILRLNARVTLQQMLQREDFRNRLDSGQEVRLHELQYPVMQGWDSVEIRADVELGGTDQLFNILVGRDMQKDEGQPQQVVMVMPLLEGLDGVKKMSKSYGNYIGVSDAPQEMYGKLMSTSDELMDRYYLLLLGETRDPASHPMDSKKSLAERLTSRYHGEEEGKAARADWDTRFSKKDLTAADLPELEISSLPAELTVLTIASHAFSSAFGMEKSNGELRKQFIISGSVQLNGEKLTNPAALFSPAPGDVLKLSKKHAVRFT
ncbi:MAG: tyrosine--tRNA ligase [Akkermansiaceae bacterium]|nr:tyrosine--tRNA ligase [Akkermansiaceae bacterium]MDP4645918.1 tyrosine--tRNA ligase [Akkermansiaceae bacterium]MDP4722392.1 tyrosine--tRNA ligase [Akkermansiaceae bacterium]MDP4779238.1 tyrosine--tRNA ligase [Akkermansiaceae bacterium]MDP4848147.1 tyrosine--tRNA ligase [Akkermansiaceae bacterium]